MAKVIGGDLVGMSTTLEAIAARQAGLEVLGISLVTNLAAGISDQPLSHDEVLEAGQAAAERCGRLLAAVVADLRIPDDVSARHGRERPTPSDDASAGLDARRRGSTTTPTRDRAELGPASLARPTRGQRGPRPRTSWTGSPACSSSAPPGCVAPSAAARTG